MRTTKRHYNARLWGKAQNYRTELGEQGTNNRFNANLGFDAQKFRYQ